METLNLIQVRRSAGRRWVVALGAALSVSITGCGSLPRTPGGFSPLQADITSTTGDVAIEIDGPSGKGTGAASGAAKGTGIGLLVGLLASASCGPLAGLCAGVVLPTTTTIGAVSGAAVGAVRADSAADVERKKRLLATELAASPYSNLLAEQLRQRVRERHDIALPDETPAAATPIAQASDTSGRATQWQIEVLLTQVTQLRGTRDKALLLRVEGRLRLRRVGAPDVLYETVQNAMSEAAWTTDPWGEDSAQDLRNAMMQSLRALADKMMLDLTRATATR